MKKLLSVIAAGVISVTAVQANAQYTHNVSGTGNLTHQEGSSDLADSVYVYEGAGTLDGDIITIDLVTHINPDGGVSADLTQEIILDITTGQGTIEVLNCSNDAFNFICPTIDLNAGQVSYLTAGIPNSSNLNAITWTLQEIGQVIDDPFSEVDILADSNSALTATGPYVAPPVEEAPAGCAYNPKGSIDMLLMLLLAGGLFYGRNALARR